MTCASGILSCSRLVLVTGVTKGGLGFEVAKQLVSKGHRVILACRDTSKAKDAAAELQQLSQGLAGAGSKPLQEPVDWVQMDLASFASVCDAAHEVRRRYDSLDGLVLNAGMIPPAAKPQLTADGWELAYQTNHLGHVLLVHHLLPALARSQCPGGSRILTVSSLLHSTGLGALPPSPAFLHLLSQPASCTPAGAGQQLDPAGQQQLKIQQQQLSPQQIYALTKLCGMWFTLKLSSVLQQAQLPVPITADAVSPGFIPNTNLSRTAPWPARMAMYYLMPWAPFATSLQEGGQRVVDALLGPAALASGQTSSSSTDAPSADGEAAAFGSGRYFSRGRPCPPSPASLDTQKQEAMWALSLQAVGVPEGDFLAGLNRQG